MCETFNFNFIPAKCEPYSEAACITALQSIGYQTATMENSGYDFLGDYGNKGMGNGNLVSSKILSMNIHNIQFNKYDVL